MELLEFLSRHMEVFTDRRSTMLHRLWFGYYLIMNRFKAISLFIFLLFFHFSARSSFHSDISGCFFEIGFNIKLEGVLYFFNHPSSYLFTNDQVINHTDHFLSLPSNPCLKIIIFCLFRRIKTFDSKAYQLISKLKQLILILVFYT